MAARGAFAEELTWAIECLEEAESAVRRCHYLAGFEERPPALGVRLKRKENGVAVQRHGLEEVAEGAFG
ncbi:MAG TPA: hypothetical protein VHZ54_14030 [Solirubrobacterales bacterium]|nr:hypothetical protein [Solirubrobacterales bacterium]